MNNTIHVKGVSVPHKKVETSFKLLKYCIAMKLFLAILILSFNVSASVYSQKISLSYKDASLREVLQSIRKQSGYSFLFTSSVLNVAKPVTVNLDQVDIEKTLQIIFSDQPLNYRIDDKVIVIKSKTQKDSSILQRVKDFFLSITITGKITDEEGKPLPGASIKANGKATISNSNGEFSLSGVEENAIVEISYVGFKPNKIKASTDFLSIRMERNTSDLNEVIINKGYYSTTKATNTGNVSVVTAKELAKNPVGDPINALEGHVPGLSIVQQSGIPGSSSTVRIRGRNSIANGNNPLYIVDGVPFTSNSLSVQDLGGALSSGFSPFANIRVNDIESIEVLKDADATAIYGSRGANGVILITTKKGMAGKTRVDVNVYTGIEKSGSKLKVLNTEQYLDMRNQALKNDGLTAPGDGDYDLNGQWGDPHRNIDWQKIMLGGTGHVIDAQTTVSGGNENTQFLYGGGYRREGTIFPGDYRNSKASFHANINNVSENKRFRSNLSINYVNDNNSIPSTDFSSFILSAPNSPDLYNTDGTLNWANSTWINPFWYKTITTLSVTDNLNGALNLSYELVKGLSVSARMGYNDIKTTAPNTNPFLNYDPAVPADPSYRCVSSGNNRIKSWIIEPGINYSREIGKGKLDALVGASIQQNDYTGLYQYASGFTSTSAMSNIAAATSITNTVTDTRYRYNAIYARVGYNYQDKYILNLTGRRDASSRFGPGKQFANLGAIGAAWIVSHMDWFKNVLPNVSFAKLRASYGITGNDQLQDYAFLSTYSYNNLSYQGVNGINPTALSNPKFSWETVKKLEAGIDIGLLDQRLMLNASWYRNRTGNQLVGYALPTITGFSTVKANLPAVIQNQGTEFEVTGLAIKGQHLNWTISGNLSVPKNELISYPNLAGSGYSTTYAVGQPLSVVFLYHYTGIDPTTHVYTFEDTNKDSQITDPIDKKPVFVGQKFAGGINNSFSYKGMQLDFFFQFVKQNGFRLLSPDAPGILNPDAPNQVLATINGDHQQFTQSYGTAANAAYGLYKQSDGILVDASFIRLKNVSLSWTLPEKYQHALKLHNARIFMQGQNLFTITKFKGLDPEMTQSRGNYTLTSPLLRIITAGVQLSL